MIDHIIGILIIAWGFGMFYNLGVIDTVDRTYGIKDDLRNMLINLVISFVAVPVLWVRLPVMIVRKLLGK